MIRDLWEARVAAAAAAVGRSRYEVAPVAETVPDMVPVGPHLCEDCGSHCTLVSRDQHDAFQRDGIIPCDCGGIIRPVRDVPARGAGR